MSGARSACFATIAKDSAAQEPAGATIAMRADIWIPLNQRTATSGKITDGCGNDALWKSQIDFHRTWKSRTDREIPTFPQAASFLLLIKNEGERTRSYTA